MNTLNCISVSASIKVLVVWIELHMIEVVTRLRPITSGMTFTTLEMKYTQCNMSNVKNNNKSHIISLKLYYELPLM